MKYTSIYHSFLDIAIIILLTLPIDINISAGQIVIITIVAVFYTLIGKRAPEKGVIRFLYYPSIFGIITLMPSIAAVYAGPMGGLVALMMIHPLIISQELGDDHFLSPIYKHKSRYIIYPLVLFLFLEGISQFLQENLHTEYASSLIIFAYAPFRILIYAEEEEKNWEQLLKIISIGWAAYSLYFSIISAPHQVFWETQEPGVPYQKVTVVSTKNDSSFQYLTEELETKQPLKLLSVKTKKMRKARKIMVQLKDKGSNFEASKWEKAPDLLLQYAMLENQYSDAFRSTSISDRGKIFSQWKFFSPIYFFFPHNSRLYMQLDQSKMIVTAKVVEDCSFVESSKTYQIKAGVYPFAITKKKKRSYYIIDWKRTEELHHKYLDQPWYVTLKMEQPY